MIVASARETAVPAGAALAVDRQRFSALVEARITAQPRIRLHREEVGAIPLDRPVIVACGPLPTESFLSNLDAVLSRVGRFPAKDERPERLHYYDAASPIVAADSIDESQMYRKSRYEKGDGDDYLNIPLDRDAYARFVGDLRTLERHPAKEFEQDALLRGLFADRRDGRPR